MLTRRQRNSLRGFTAALSCSALLAAFLIFTNISNASDAEPVVFSDILEGAVAYNDGSDMPAETVAEEEMTETMFADELATFTLRLSPDYIPQTEERTHRTAPEDITIDIDGLFANTTSAADDTTVTAASTNTSELPSADGIILLPNEPSLMQPEDTSVTAESYATYSYAYQGTVRGTRTSESTETSAPETVTETSPIQTTTTQTTTVTTTTPQTTVTTTTELTTVTTTTTTTAQTTTTPQTTTTTTSQTTTTPRTTTTTTTTTTTPATTTTPKTTTTASATTTPVSTQTDKTAFTNVGGGVFSTDSTIYLTLFRLVNEARKEAGVKELWYSARVNEVCELRTTELTSYYSHTRPNGTKFNTAYKELGISYSFCGENIAYGRNMFKTPEEVFQAWMNSPSHRDNILNPDFECVAFGLCTLRVGTDMYYYWSQEFAVLG